MSGIDRLSSFMGFDMPRLIKTALYILVVIGVSLVICKYIVGFEIDNDWLYGALLAPLIAVVADSRGKKKSYD